MHSFFKKFPTCFPFTRFIPSRSSPALELNFDLIQVSIMLLLGSVKPHIHVHVKGIITFSLS